LFEDILPIIFRFPHTKIPVIDIGISLTI